MYALVVFWIFAIHAVNYGMQGENPAIGEKQLQFIKTLFNENRYFDCIAETRRYLLLNPTIDDTTKTALTYFIAANYYLGGQYQSAEKIVHEELPENYIPGKILLSQSFNKLGFFEKSLHTLKEMSYPESDPLLRYEILMRKIDALIALHKYDEAVREIDSQKIFFNSAKLDELSSMLASFVQKPPFDETRAMIYSSVLPGAGQWYAQRYFDSILSFIAVFSAGLSTVYFHRQGNESMRGFCALFCALFYIGNIYGAYNSAVSTNRMATQKFHDHIRNDYIHPYDPRRYIELKSIVHEKNY
ncbi:MAG: hypothetical protein N2316_13910 [Spirochaetes bacterium]|nr:hypothetical protein [Spirochaetota bacterium]